MSISGDTQHMHTFLYLYNKYSPFDLSFNKAMKTKKKKFHTYTCICHVVNFDCKFCIYNHPVNSKFTA